MFHLPYQFPKCPVSIQHSDKIMLIGSCFSEHIYQYLNKAKFSVISNPHGILFNPLSVTKSLRAYAKEVFVNKNELFYLNELWNHWDFHSLYSDIEIDRAVNAMNQSIHKAHHFIKEANWLIITLGSSFQYYNKTKGETGFVGNCHRAPGQWFEKKLLGIEEMHEDLNNTIEYLKTINPLLNIVLTISPVRHIRDGVVENNRSKARLLEVVHQLVDYSKNIFYFPAYELIIDVLRDYRYYDIDLVHPNFAATEFVWQQFQNMFFSASAKDINTQMEELYKAYNHKPRFDSTQLHKTFKEKYLSKVLEWSVKLPYANFENEIAYFSEK